MKKLSMTALVVTAAIAAMATSASALTLGDDAQTCDNQSVITQPRNQVDWQEIDEATIVAAAVAADGTIGQTTQPDGVSVDTPNGYVMRLHRAKNCLARWTVVWVRGDQPVAAAPTDAD